MMEEIDLSWEKYISEKIFQTISSKFSRYPIRLSNSTLCTVCTSCFTRLPLGATKSVFHAFFIAPDVVPRRNSSVGYSHREGFSILFARVRARVPRCNSVRRTMLDKRRKTRRRRVDERETEKDEPLYTVYEILCTHRSCAQAIILA